MKNQSLTLPSHNSFLSISKGISILLIVLYHYFPFVDAAAVLRSAAQLGGAGIYIFLFASGYGLYYSRSSNWNEYFKKRFQRVLLPYYIVITLIFLLNEMLALYPAGWQAYLGHVLLYKMLYEPFASSFGNHFWFVSTIIQFYLLWPLISYWIRKRPALEVLILAFGISISYSILIYSLGFSETRILFRFVLQYIWVLVLGALVAKTSYLNELLTVPNWVYIGLGSLNLAVVYGIYFYAGNGGMMFNDYFMFMAFFSGCVLFYRFTINIAEIQKVVLWVDVHSYYLYLLHIFFLTLYMTLSEKKQINMVETGMIFLMSILGSWLLKNGVEKVFVIMQAQQKTKLNSMAKIETT